MTSMWAGRFLCFCGGGVWGEDVVPVGCIWTPCGLGCCPFWGGGSVVVDFCLLLLPLWGSVVVLCFVMRCFVSILVLQSSWWGRGVVALLDLSSWCLMMVERLFLALPWGCLQFVIVVFPDHTHLLFR